MFDKTNGKLLKHIRFPRNFERQAFSPDGTRLACSGMVTGNDMRSVVQIWELPDSRKVQEFEVRGLQWLGWSTNGQPLAVLLGKGVVVLRELATREERRFQVENLPDIERGLTSCAYAAEGRTLAVPDEQGIIHVWNTATGQKRCTLQAKGKPSGVLVLSPEGRSLALIIEDAASKYVVQVWNVATGKATQIAASDQPYTAVIFTPDGKTLATIGRSEIRLWDVATGREQARILWKDSIASRPGHYLEGGPFFGSHVLFSPDGKTLITTESVSNTLHVWDVATSALHSSTPDTTRDLGTSRFRQTDGG